jgi:hypothetical protein
MTDCTGKEFDLQILATEYEKFVVDTVTTSDFWKGNLWCLDFYFANNLRESVFSKV